MCVCVFICVFWKKCHEENEKREEEKQQNTKQGLLLLPAAAAAALSIASKEVKEKRTSRQRQHEARQRGRE